MNSDDVLKHESNNDGAIADEAGETTALLGKSRDCHHSWSCGACDFLSDLNGAIGYKLLALLFVVEHVMRGFVADFTGQAESYVYKAYAVPAPQMQVYKGITGLPWALKPIIGLVSDVYPICGYHKAPYMIAASVTGALAFLAVGAIPQNMLPVPLLVASFFMQAMQLSSIDILSEAKYAEKIREKPQYGPNILSYVWFGLNAGSLLGMLLSGVVIGGFSAKLPYLISAFPAAIVLLPVGAGYLEERKVSAEEAEESRKKFYQQKEASFLSIMMFVVVAVLTAIGMTSGSTHVNAAAAIVGGLVVVFFFGILLSPQIAMFNAWSLMQTSLSLSTSGAAFYFMTDTPEQYPEGPHFSAFFYTSVIGTFGSVMSLIGVVTFQKYLSGFRYRNLFVVTNIAVSLLNLLDMLLYTRLNVRWGIPDHAFILGTGCLQNVIGQWQWLPQVVILSYFCPKGMEATVYALLAGCHNLGNTIASNVGALLLELLHVNPNGSVNESAQFENLWKASLIASLLPTITVVALFKFIPDVKQGDPLMEETASASQGSLWKQFWGIRD
eukprot:gb/GFBE01045254.1/.p1 GENE.gb/GFBE01045254.1/~~gb/GFBE01045254.1/.p1  ORF type:complete len:554 (+),score=117.67 gb/GFBE01045254.1/:1-1662(+)